MKKEFNKLQTMYSSYDIQVIFGSFEGYKRVREYTTYKDVLNELELICVPKSVYPQQY